MRFLERKERAKLEQFMRAIGASWWDDDEDELTDDWLMAA